MTWDDEEILALAGAALEAESRILDDGQEPKGLDSFTEKQIQEIAARGIEGGGYLVLREEVFPSIRRAGARRSQRERCDLAVLPKGASAVRESREHSESLAFGGAAEAGPDEVYWLEMKVLGQFEYRKGIPVPNRQYTTNLIKAFCDDLIKLDDDPLIRSACVIQVLFVESEKVAEHDIAVAMGRCIDRGIIPSTPRVRSFPIADRIGNRLCTVWQTTLR